MRAALAQAPVVLVVGPRQSGKSTLAQQFVRERKLRRYVTLDDLGTLDGIRRDPVGFIAEQDHVVIDEVQRVPDLLIAIKASVDRDRRPGRYLLTGSADVLFLPNVAESLAGRMRVFTLWPFSQCELERRASTFIDRAFGAARMPDLDESENIRADLFARAFRGGFPEAVRGRPAVRADFFDSYVASVLVRELPQLSEIAGRGELPRLAALLAARSMSVLNLADISRTVGIAHTTLTRYMSLLEVVFFAHRVPAWSANVARRLVRHPKITLTDSGLVAHLAGFDRTRLASDPVLAGPLLESFVAMELRKAIAWSKARPELFHYRSHEGAEVDLVLETRDGRAVGIEVKASSTPRGDDFRGLEALRQDLGKKFVRGVLLYTGTSTVRFADKLLAMPMSALWKL